MTITPAPSNTSFQVDADHINMFRSDATFTHGEFSGDIVIISPLHSTDHKFTVTAEVFKNGVFVDAIPLKSERGEFNAIAEELAKHL